MASITRPDFTKIPLDLGTHPRQREKAAVCWMTHEQIPVKSYYAAEDLAGFQHLDYAAGMEPRFFRARMVDGVIEVPVLGYDGVAA